MTTYFPFVPNSQAPFSFQPTLDGDNYAATVTWNLFGQRWYLNVSQQSGGLVFSLPLLGSPDGTQLDSVSWSHGTVTAECKTPHGYALGTTVNVTITGCVPDAYNGVWPALIVDRLTFQFALASDAGSTTQLGQQIYNINIAAGYFTTSTLVFRASSQTFEVTP